MCGDGTSWNPAPSCNINIRGFALIKKDVLHKEDVISQETSACVPQLRREQSAPPHSTFSVCVLPLEASPLQCHLSSEDASVVSASACLLHHCDTRPCDCKRLFVTAAASTPSFPVVSMNSFAELSLHFCFHKWRVDHSCGPRSYTLRVTF